MNGRQLDGWGMPRCTRKLESSVGDRCTGCLSHGGHPFMAMALGIRWLGGLYGFGIGPLLCAIILALPKLSFLFNMPNC